MPAGASFPFVRMLGAVAIVGVNSAVTTLPLVASGRVGAEQLARLDKVLERLGRAGHFRLVLIHHPPLPGQAKRLRGLRDAAELERIAARHGAELVVHGHNHHNMLAWCGTGPTATPVVGAPSASLARPHKAEPLARYNLYRIEGPPWSIELIGRGLENGRRRDRGAGAASIAAGGPGMTKGHESPEKYSRSRTPATVVLLPETSRNRDNAESRAAGARGDPAPLGRHPVRPA